MPQLYLTRVKTKGTFLINNEWFIITNNTGEIGPITPALVVDILNEKAALQKKTLTKSTQTNETPTTAEIATQTKETPTTAEIARQTKETPTTAEIATQTNETPTTAEIATQTDKEKKDKFSSSKKKLKEMDKLISECEQLKAKYKQLKAKYKQLKAKNEQLLAKNEKLQAENKRLQNQGNKKKEKPENKSFDAFKTFLSKDANAQNNKVSNSRNEPESEIKLDSNWKKEIDNELSKAQKEALKKIENNTTLENNEYTLLPGIIKEIQNKYYARRKIKQSNKDFLKDLLESSLEIKKKK